MARTSNTEDLTPQFDITVADFLRYRSQYWRFIRRRGCVLDFLEPRSNELLSVSDEILAGLICSGSANIVRGEATQKDEEYAAATADLSTYNASDIEDGRRKLAYVEELQHRDLTYRPPGYDVAAAIDTVSKQLSDPQPPQPYLVKRWLKKAISRAAASGRKSDQLTIGDLVPLHGFKGNRTSRVSFEVSKIIHAKIAEVYLTPERPSVETLLSVVRTTVRDANRNRDPADQLRLPGRSAVDSAIRSIDRRVVTQMRYGSDKAYAQYGPVEYRKRPIAPLEEIEIDHTSGDLFCLDSISGAPLGRPTVALGTDRCTAMPWGVYVGFDPPSVHTVMQLLRNGLFPKTYVRAYADAGIWKIENSWPAFGRPVKLSVDRASENLGHDLRAFGVDLPIKEIEAKAGRTGRFKGQIERLLGTLNRNLLQQQRGTTFSNILERGDYDPRKNAVITYEELLEKIHAWLIDVYMRQPHNGIKDVPIRLWNEKIQLYRPHQIENVEGVLPLFGRIEHRVLRRDGIRWKNLFYTSPELMSLLANRKFRTAAADPCGNIVVRFRYDPSNISSIHVYLPHARGQSSMHLLVPVEKRAAEYARGLSVWAHDSIASIARAKLNASIDLASLDRAKSQLISDMESQTPASIKVRGALRIARMRQIGGLAPFGDQLRTTPDGSFEDARQISAVTCSDPLSDMRAGKGTKLDRYEVRDQSGEQSTSHSPLTVESGKGRKYRRGDDPQEISNSKPLSANRRDHTVPVIHIDQDDDEVDFYSEDIKP